MKTIKQEWESFKRCIHPQAPERQVEEMQMAFYSGAITLHRLLLESITPGEEVQDADMQLMERIEQEFTEFNEQLVVRAAIRNPK